MTEAPYDYAGFRRAAQTISREHRDAINAGERAGKALAVAESEYHKHLAITVSRLRPEGATVAETLAKGEPMVRQAKEERDQAAAIDRAAMERIRLCRDDRAVLLAMGAWSRQVNGWEA
jgi:predicted ATPase